MHFLANTTFSLPFFFSVRVQTPKPDFQPAPARSAKPVTALQRGPAAAATIAGSAATGTGDQTPTLASRSARCTRTTDQATTFHMFPAALDGKHSRHPHGDLCVTEHRQEPSTSAAQCAPSLAQHQGAAMSPFQREFPPQAKFLELVLDQHGELQAGAGADRTLRKADPQAVRECLRNEFKAALILKLGSADQQAIDSHWKAALGIHAGAGTNCRPVLVHHLNLLAQHVDLLPGVR